MHSAQCESANTADLFDALYEFTIILLQLAAYRYSACYQTYDRDSTAPLLEYSIACLLLFLSIHYVKMFVNPVIGLFPDVGESVQNTRDVMYISYIAIVGTSFSASVSPWSMSAICSTATTDALKLVPTTNLYLDNPPKNP